MVDGECVIDAHVHPISLAFNRYPVRKLTRWDEIYDDSGTEQLFTILAGSPVSRMVLIQAPQYADDHRLLFDLRDDHPEKFAIVPVVDWKALDAGDMLKKYKDRAVRGVRIYPMAGDELGTWLQYPLMQRLWREAERLKIAMCFLIDVCSLPSLKRQCQQFPGVKVVIDHMCRIGADGYIRPNEVEELCGLAQFPNVYVKVSAFWALSKLPGDYTDLLRPLIRPVIKAFGPDRVMFATDFPLETVRHYMAAVTLLPNHQYDVGLDDTGLLAVMGGTARKLFFPEPE